MKTIHIQVAVILLPSLVVLRSKLCVRYRLSCERWTYDSTIQKVAAVSSSVALEYFFPSSTHQKTWTAVSKNSRDCECGPSLLPKGPWNLGTFSQYCRIRDRLSKIEDSDEHIKMTLRYRATLGQRMLGEDF
ncbi:hypothetical protein EDD18DRAFT_174441 [Armillaria luteobubalina]|uniref:Uncharacterized protein n=1 Tax=Armillaria luteobubalina TaxID=153913 RepID=A0AA39Q7G4_9AGAR|nr:hypothetical protein EDD18DRAFT_174441 [Armillaria luteobubalina]